MRGTQMFGLTNLAQQFLEKYQKKDVCGSCHMITGRTEETIGHTGMFNEAPLKEYTLIDGRKAKEFVQYEPWSSGPMIFLKLLIDDGTQFYWTPKEANKTCGEDVILDFDPDCTKCDGGIIETNKTEHGAYISVCKCVKEAD